MSDIGDRLRALFDDEARPIDPTYIPHSVHRKSSVHRRFRVRPGWQVGIAAGLIALVFGGSALLLRMNSDGGIAGQATSATQPTEAGPAASSQEASIEWTQGSLPEEFNVHTITAAGGYFFGLAWDEIEEPDPRTRLWLSEDGANWEAIDVDATSFGMRAGYFTEIAALGDGFIATVKGESLASGLGELVVVTSTDARAWVPTDIGSDQEIPAEVLGVGFDVAITGDPGFVDQFISSSDGGPAVVFETGVSYGPDDPSYFFPATIWWTLDGEQWMELAGSEAFGFEGTIEVASAKGTTIVVVYYSHPDRVGSLWTGVVAGADTSPTEAATTTTPVVAATSSPTSAATSTDGWALTEVPQTHTLLEATDRGFVAISSHKVRTSTDGLNWEEVASLDEGVWVFDIEHRGSTLVAAGSGFVDSLTGEQPPDAVWTSTDDGETWIGTEIGEVADIAVTPDGFAAVGVKADNSDPLYNRSQGVLWTSADGLTWTQVATSNDPEGVSSSFRNVVWDEQLVILGHRGPDAPSEANLSGGEPHDNVTWFSDGTDLSEPSLSNLGGNLDADSTAVTPYGIIATTHWWTPTVKTVAAAWISPDGITWTELDIELGNYEYTNIAQDADDVFLIGYKLGEGGEQGVWTTDDGSTWSRIALPEGFGRGLTLEVEVSESTLLIAGDTHPTGIIASRTRR